MHTWKPLVGTLVVLLLVAGFGYGAPVLSAAPVRQVQFVISYPSDGTTVSGAVEIVGIASHPSMDRYQVFYAAGGQPAGDSFWVNVSTGNTSVENGGLGVWNTTSIPDGLYTLTLVVWGAGDPTPYQTFVRNITVDNANAQPTPVPTPEPPTPEPLPTAVEALPTAAPVQLPTLEPTPTSTPAQVAEGGPEIDGGLPAQAEEDEARFVLDVAGLQDAFCAGAQLTVLVFGVLALYGLLKAFVRLILRMRKPSPPQV